MKGRDPTDETRVWVLFDWDDEGCQKLLSDPDMPAIFQGSGPYKGGPEKAELVREQGA
jgi:hypothetical protein